MRPDPSTTRRDGLDDPVELRAAGRMVGAVWMVGGISGVLWYLVPGADLSHWQLGLVTCALTIAIGLACVLGPWHRLGMAHLRASAVASLIVIPVVIALNGGADSPTVLYLFLATVVFGYYLPTREAIGFLAVGMLVPATPMLYDPEALRPTSIAEVFLTAPIYAAVGLVVIMAKRRLVGWRDRALDQALLDPLTALPNRRALSQALAAAAGGEPERPIALVMIDLDDFKRANTQLGHLGGDRVLRQTAAVLRSAVREDDFVARLGGDEFAVLVLGLEGDLLEALADRVVRAIRESTDMFGITASVGVAVLARGGRWEIDDVLGSADQEMRRAKLAGKDGWRSVAA